MKLDFSGKSVLFFCPKFFGYEREISEKMISMGADVDSYDERPKNNFVTKASIRINKNLIKRRIEQYYNKILNESQVKKYDYVFVVNIEAMLPDTLRKLKEQQPSATFILYMWDSLQNKARTLPLLPLFDHVFSFDKTDAEKIKGVRFRPLFFIDTYKDIAAKGSSPHSGLCFIGTVHSDRYHLINEIRKQLKAFNLDSYFFMFFASPILFAYKKMRDAKFYQARISEFSFKPLKKEEIIRRIETSSVVLDIEHPGQTGLTMRTIEMLGAQKKLITTNASVKDYDFYRKENILIIDRNNPVLLQSFFLSEYQKIDEAIYYKYSIEGWLSELFHKH